MPVATTPDLDIYYERGGVGETLFYISGSGADLRNKPNQFDSPLAQAFDLLCYDQRGLGQTSKPAGDYNMAQYADDAAALLDMLQIEKVPVLGVSFGGMVGQEFALRHPDRVSALALACTSSGGRGGASFPLHEIQELPDAERARAHLQVADLRHTDAWINANPHVWEKRLRLTQTAQRVDRDRSGALQQLDARRWHDTYERLDQLKMPVLLIGGEYDGIAPVANMQAMHSRIERSELRFFDGGHMFLIQDKLAYPYIIQWVIENI